MEAVSYFTRSSITTAPVLPLIHHERIALPVVALPFDFERERKTSCLQRHNASPNFAFLLLSRHRAPSVLSGGWVVGGGVGGGGVPLAE